MHADSSVFIISSNYVIMAIYTPFRSNKWAPCHSKGTQGGITSWLVASRSAVEFCPDDS